MPASKRDQRRALENLARAIGAVDAAAEDLGGRVLASNESDDPLVAVRRALYMLKDGIAGCAANVGEVLDPNPTEEG